MGTGDPYYDAERRRSFAPNLWPEQPAGFCDAAWTYFGAVRNLSHELADFNLGDAMTAWTNDGPRPRLPCRTLW